MHLQLLPTYILLYLKRPSDCPYEPRVYADLPCPSAEPGRCGAAWASPTKYETAPP